LPDQLDEARLRYPLGAEVPGRFLRWILPDRPGTAGMVIDLGDGMQGYVDVLTLPAEPADWPSIDTQATFEVTQHRPGSLRLWPMDPAHRSPDRQPQSDRRERLARYPIGTIVTGVVFAVYVSNRECTIRIGADEFAVAEWSGEPPVVGATAEYEVISHLKSFGAIVLR